MIESAIYTIKNIKNGKVYVGSAVNVTRMKGQKRSEESRARMSEAQTRRYQAGTMQHGSDGRFLPCSPSIIT